MSDAGLSERDAKRRVLIEFVARRHLGHLPFHAAVREATKALEDMDELQRNRVEDDMIAEGGRRRELPQYDPWKGML